MSRYAKQLIELLEFKMDTCDDIINKCPSREHRTACATCIWDPRNTDERLIQASNLKLLNMLEE